MVGRSNEIQSSFTKGDLNDEAMETNLGNTITYLLVQVDGCIDPQLKSFVDWWFSKKTGLRGALKRAGEIKILLDHTALPLLQAPLPQLSPDPAASDDASF